MDREMDDFDLTQPMSLCYDDDDDPIPETDEAAILMVPVQNGIPRKLEFSLYNGLNKIGRSESCEVRIQNKVLSKEHAVIEVGGDCFLIYDLNSSNKTWKAKKPLKPNVKYKLESNDEISFGNIRAQFIVKRQEVDEVGDSGSETGSESMLLQNEEFCGFSVSTPIKNANVSEGGNALVNASTSKGLSPKTLNANEAKNTESPKEATLDLENAVTQAFNGSNFSDSDDETDCEDLSAERTVTKEREVLNSGSVCGTHCVDGTAKKESVTSRSNPIKVLDHDGKTSKPAENLANQAQGGAKMINVQFSEKISNKQIELPDCHSVDSSEDLPPTQVNLALLDNVCVKGSKNLADEKLNNVCTENASESLGSLPETQVNGRIFDVNFEVPESPESEDGDDLPPAQCVSNHRTNKNNNSDDLPPTQCTSPYVKNNIDNAHNNISVHKTTVPKVGGNSEHSDDLPPTQLNPKLQFSEEMNFLQHSESQHAYDNISSPKPSTSSGTGNSRTATPQSLPHSTSVNKMSVVPCEGNSEGTSGRKSFRNKSGSSSLLSCINISVEEGSSSSILCPSTQRRSEGRDHKIKNTDLHCSPVLGSHSDENVKDSIAETPPHLLKESILGGDNSSVVASLSRRLSEVSPIASRTSASLSSSYSKTSEHPHTPSAHDKAEPKASTPDNAKAGDLNYSVNCSPKVYKTKLNDIDEDSQETLLEELNDGKATNSSTENSVGKESKHSKSHADAPSNENGVMNEDGPNSDSDTDSSRKQNRRNRKRKAAGKTRHRGVKVAKNTSPERSPVTSNTRLRAKNLRTTKPIDGVLNVFSDNHASETRGHDEGTGQSKILEKRRTKRRIAVPGDVRPESNVAKRLCFENDDGSESEEQNSKSHTENTVSGGVPVVNESNLKSDTDGMSVKKKNKNDKNAQQLPTRRSRRQKPVSDEKSGIRDISSDVMKESSRTDCQNDFTSLPKRKTARRKLLQSELDCNESNSNQGTSFSVLQKSEAQETTEGNLVDTRPLKRRKASPSKGTKEANASFKNTTSKHQMSVNDSEVFVSSSGDHCNITVQSGKSNIENLKPDASTKKDTCNYGSSNERKPEPYVALTDLSSPTSEHPSVTERGKSKALRGSSKTEKPSDSLNKTVKDDDQTSLSGKEEKPEDVLLRRKRKPAERHPSYVRQTGKKKMPNGSATDETPASSDTSAKPDDHSPLTRLTKNDPEKNPAPRSKRLWKKTVLPSNNSAEDSVTSAVSLDTSSRSLRLRLSASETSADENRSISEKCQISVFAKDSIQSLIKLGTQGTESNDVKDSEGVQNRPSRKSKLSKKEEADVSKKEEDKVSVPKVKNSRQSRSRSNAKHEFSSPAPATKRNKCLQLTNSPLLPDSTHEQDVTVARTPKTKNVKNQSVVVTSPISQSQHSIRKPKVMFTMVDDEEPQKVVVNLGGKVVEDVNACTHLVAEKLRRTVKALCCIGKGIPLVSTEWIQKCKKVDSFVDHVPFLIKDKAVEKQYQFELKKTLEKADEKPLLSSWSVHVTPKVVPSPEQMKDIIQCAGGKYLLKMPNRLSEKTVVVTCAPDLNLCSHAMKCGIPIVGSEFILTGLLQYKIDTKSYMLSKK